MMSLSKYRAMWLLVMFDLPVDTKNARTDYSRFRKMLLTQGFTMLQYSVYARYCVSEEVGSPIRRRIRRNLPPDGQVRLLGVTDRQFAKMEVFWGDVRVQAEQPPDQLLLF